MSENDNVTVSRKELLKILVQMENALERIQQLENKIDRPRK